MHQLLKYTQCLVIYLLSFAWLQLNRATTKRYSAHGHLSSLAWFQLNGATTKRYSVTGHLVVELGMVAAERGNYINILSAGTLAQLDMVAPECGNH
jgi:hypothetical protein